MQIAISRRKRTTAGARPIEFIDLTPRWKTLMPILLATIEGGTQTGRANALRGLHELADTVDSTHATQMRMRAVLTSLLDILTRSRNALTSGENAVLSEALELLEQTKPPVVPLKKR